MACRLHSAMTRWTTMIVVVALCLLCGVERASAQEVRSVSAIKAAMLYNFLKFVSWNDPEIGESDEPFSLCIAGEDPIREVLQRNLSERKAQGRRIAVRDGSGQASLADCALVFVPAAEETRLEEILASVGGGPTLTVGETDSFFEGGGMVRLSMEGKRVIFDVNVNVAKAAGLSISSKLLNLARTVENGE